MSSRFPLIVPRDVHSLPRPQHPTESFEPGQVWVRYGGYHGLGGRRLVISMVMLLSGAGRRWNVQVYPSSHWDPELRNLDPGPTFMTSDMLFGLDDKDWERVL